MADTDMTIEEREAFLADLHVAVLAIAREGAGPHALPIWYAYDGTDVLLAIEPTSVKARLLARTGRATLTVQQEALPYRYVSVEGPVTMAAAVDGDGYDLLAVADALPRPRHRPGLRRRQRRARDAHRASAARAVDHRRLRQDRSLTRRRQRRVVTPLRSR